MATAATSFSRPQAPNPTTLKFTAVKVDVSAVTDSCRCKAFVVSSQTTSRDLSDMVLQKLKINVKDHVNGTCLIGQQCDSGEKRVLSEDEKVLGLLGNKHKRALTLQLVPADKMKPPDRVASKPNQEELDVVKAGNLSDPAKNGLTLPGYLKTDVNYNLAIGSGFVTSTPNPEICESVSSNVDSGFLIHYEPLSDNTECPTSARGRSKSFELARDNGYRLDTSNDNASDSGMVLNGNNHNQDQVIHLNSQSPESTVQEYSHRLSPKDGFQILQSQNSAWTPFSRHVSDGFVRSVSYQVLPTYTKTNIPPESGFGSGLSRRRSLPKLSMSQEQIQEKQKSVTDLFTAKLKVYLQKARANKNNQDADGPTSRRHIVPLNNAPRDDDTMSVTSEEVAEIMSSASPMKPYEEEEDSTGSEYSTPETASTCESSALTENSPYVFQPLSDAIHSPTTLHHNGPNSVRNEYQRKHHTADNGSLGRFVEQSMHSFMVNTTPVNDRPPRKTDSSGDDPNKQTKAKYSAPTTQINRGVPLFTLLTTHTLAPVMVRRNREMAPDKLIGLRLCDVTYSKCVRHVIRHWASNDIRHFSVDPNLSEQLLVAIGGMDRRTTVILAGKVFRGDIVVEVNGMPTLELPARDVISKILRAEVVSLVVARSRLNVERAQSP